MIKKSKWITLVKRPTKELTLELGKLPMLEERFQYDKNKSFKSIGFVEAIKYIELPKTMNFEKAKDWINNNETLLNEINTLNN